MGELSVEGETWGYSREALRRIGIPRQGGRAEGKAFTLPRTSAYKLYR